MPNPRPAPPPKPWSELPAWQRAGVFVGIAFVAIFVLSLVFLRGQGSDFSHLGAAECNAQGGRMVPTLVETPSRAYYDYSKGLHCEP